MDVNAPQEAGSVTTYTTPNLNFQGAVGYGDLGNLPDNNISYNSYTTGPTSVTTGQLGGVTTYPTFGLLGDTSSISLTNQGGDIFHMGAVGQSEIVPNNEPLNPFYKSTYDPNAPANYLMPAVEVSESKIGDATITPPGGNAPSSNISGASDATRPGTNVFEGNALAKVEVTGNRVTEPPVTEPTVTQPQITEPIVSQPPSGQVINLPKVEVTGNRVTEPTVTLPPVTEPTVTDRPPSTQPTVSQPINTGPIVTVPKVVVNEPPLTQPPTELPTQPPTLPPVTAGPLVTLPPFTVNVNPFTQPPTLPPTQPPTLPPTQPPTLPPITQRPTIAPTVAPTNPPTNPPTMPTTSPAVSPNAPSTVPTTASTAGSPTRRNFLAEGQEVSSAFNTLSPDIYNLYRQMAGQYSQADLDRLTGMLGMAPGTSYGQMVTGPGGLTSIASQQTEAANTALRRANLQDVLDYAGSARAQYLQSNPELQAAQAALTQGGTTVNASPYEGRLAQIFGYGPSYQQVSAGGPTAAQVAASQIAAGTGAGATVSGPTAAQVTAAQIAANAAGNVSAGNLPVAQIAAGTGGTINALNSLQNPVLAAAQQQALAAGMNPLEQQMLQRAQDQMALGGSLSAEDVRNAQQAAREAYSARGQVMSQGAAAQEVLNRQALSQQRMAERQQYAQNVNQQLLAAQQARNQYGLGVIGAGQAASAQDIQAQLANQAAGLDIARLNQAALMQAGTTGGELGLRAALANQAAGLDIARLNQSAAQQAALANQQAALQAGTTGSELGLRATLANQAANLDVARLNQAAQQQAALANQQAGLQAGTSTSELALRAALANQAAGQTAQQQNIALGQSLSATDVARQQQNIANALQNVQLQSGVAFNPFQTILGQQYGMQTQNVGTNAALAAQLGGLGSGQGGYGYVQQAYFPYNQYGQDVFNTNVNAQLARDIAAQNNAAAVAAAQAGASATRSAANTAAYSTAAAEFLKGLGLSLGGG